jgi:hypothetical protein
MDTNNEPQKAKISTSNKFTAVDLSMLAAFAVLIRVLWYLVKMFDVVFPFSMSLLAITYALGVTAALVVIRKQWTVFLFTVAWMLINFFLQGEPVQTWIYVMIGFPILPELFIFIRRKSGVDPAVIFGSKQIIFAGALYGIIGVITVLFQQVTFFLTAIPMIAMMITVGITVVTSTIGAALGKALGSYMAQTLKH